MNDLFNLPSKLLTNCKLQPIHLHTKIRPEWAIYVQINAIFR